MRNILGSVRSARSARAASGALALLAALTLTVGTVGAQEESGLTPAFGDGRLSVSGAGFRPGERVTVSVAVDGGPRQERLVVADAQGRFRLDTGLPVRPGASVALEARGDQETVQAALTSVPAAPPAGAAPTTAGPAAPPRPTTLPRTGGPWPGGLVLVGAGGVVLLLGGGALGRRRP
jgi:hypothetical protein